MSNLSNFPLTKFRMLSFDTHLQISEVTSLSFDSQRELLMEIHFSVFQGHIIWM